MVGVAPRNTSQKIVAVAPRNTSQNIVAVALHDTVKEQSLLRPATLSVFFPLVYFLLHSLRRISLITLKTCSAKALSAGRSGLAGIGD